MRHFMCDLETLGRRAGCKILSIGLTEFALGAGVPKSPDFYVRVRNDAQHGLHENEDTVRWWARQSLAARQEVFDNSEAVPLKDALLKLDKYLLDYGRSLPGGAVTACVWGNGSDFDNAVLHAAFAACALPTPWDHWNNRCYRTLKNLAPNVKLERVGTFHNALDDARSQAAHADAIVAHLGLKLS